MDGSWGVMGRFGTTAMKLHPFLDEVKSESS